MLDRKLDQLASGDQRCLHTLLLQLPRHHLDRGVERLGVLKIGLLRAITSQTERGQTITPTGSEVYIWDMAVAYLVYRHRGGQRRVLVSYRVRDYSGQRHRVSRLLELAQRQLEYQKSRNEPFPIVVWIII